MGVSSFIVTTQPDWGEFGAELISLFAITITCTLFGIKTHKVKYRQLSYARWLVVMLYVCSWSFTTSATLLASTNNGNHTSCFLSILACDLFYCGTKMTIYLWLIERAYIVDDSRKTRIDSWAYRFHIFLMTPYIAIFVLMIIYHNAIMVDTGQCYIGLQPIANIPVLVYDTIFNLYMTILFVIPLIRVGREVNTHWKKSKLYDLTKRSLIASTVCLVASFANALGATIMKGQQRGFLCMMCCTIDVTINVLTIHWVTTPSKVHHPPGRISELSTANTLPGPSHTSFLGPPSPSISVSHLEQSLHSTHPSPSLYSHRSSISMQDSHCSTKSLTTKSPIV